MTETVDNETRAFIEAVQLLEDAGWVVLRPDSKLFRQSDTRIEGGGERLVTVMEMLRDKHSSPTGTDEQCGAWDMAQRLIGVARNYQAASAPSSPTPEHVEGDVLSVGEMEALVSELERLSGERELRMRADIQEDRGIATLPDIERAAMKDYSVLQQAISVLTSATTRIQRAEGEIERQQALVSSSEAERVRSCGELMIRATTAEAQLADAVKVLEGMVRLSELGFEESLKETEESGNFAAFERAKSFLSTIGEKPDAE